ncbi:hypothetical protein HanIR_Chr14g0722921 [Helianthus annuus]|nr:hypothetical protein HanIR_Chr14g0722921 [Helianthus annuus]
MPPPETPLRRKKNKSPATGKSSHNPTAASDRGIRWPLIQDPELKRLRDPCLIMIIFRGGVWWWWSG